MVLLFLLQQLHIESDVDTVNKNMYSLLTIRNKVKGDFTYLNAEISINKKRAYIDILDISSDGSIKKIVIMGFSKSIIETTINTINKIKESTNIDLKILESSSMLSINGIKLQKIKYGNRIIKLSSKILDSKKNICSVTDRR